MGETFNMVLILRYNTDETRPQIKRFVFGLELNERIFFPIKLINN